MARHSGVLGTLTIANGQTASNELSGGVIGHAVDFVIYVPTTLTGTVTLQLSWLDAPTSTDWRTANYNGADIALGAGDAVGIPLAAIKAMRVLSGSTELADRVFTVMAQWEGN